MLIFMYFYIKKLFTEHGGSKIFIVPIFSIFISVLSVLLGLGIIYLLNKFRKFDSYKKIIIPSYKEIVVKSLLLIITVLITSIIIYFVY